MICKNCNAEMGDFRFCSQCGADNGEVKVSEATVINETYGNVKNNDKESGTALASMICGILSLTGVGGLITAIIALVLSSKYTKSDSTGSESYAKVGKITGIIAVVMNALAILFAVLYIVFYIFMLIFVVGLSV